LLELKLQSKFRNSEKSESSNNQDYNTSLIKLHKLLYDKLFLDKIQSCNSKEDLHFYNKPKDKYEALHDNFIKYGTKKATSFIIIDIDYIKTPIKQYREEVIYKLGLEPNWITRTSKGYHIGFILDSTIWLNNSEAKEKLLETKKNLTYLLNGDVIASLKEYGYWRNPLTHKSIINTKKTYSLKELYKASNKQVQSSITLFDTKEIITKKLKTASLKKEDLIKINVDKIQKDGFVKGNRNNFLFTKIISMLYKGQITNNQVLSTLIELNNNQLELKEIKRIAKSIIKYNIKPNSSNSKSYQPGEYYQDLWENQIHNYKKANKIEFSRQKFGQKITTAKIITSTIQKLIEGYKITYQKNEVFTNANIVKNSKVAKSTIKRYRNVRKLEKEIKTKAFMMYIKEIVDIERIKTNKKEKSVKANEPLLRDLLNLALTELHFEYEKTGKLFAFEYNEENMLVFYEIEQIQELEVA